MCARVCPCAVRARLWASLMGADAGLGGSPRSPAMSWLYEWGQPASSLSAAPLCVSGGFFLMTGRGDSASLTTSPAEPCRAHAQKGLSLVRAPAGAVLKFQPGPHICTVFRGLQVLWPALVGTHDFQRRARLPAEALPGGRGPATHPAAASWGAPH